MVSDNIKFEAANIATILWPDHGFEPESEGGIVAVGKKLTEEFANENITDKLREKLGLNSDQIVFRQPEFDTTKGNEHIKLTLFSDGIVMNGFTADKVIFRVHVCNRIDGRRAKITVFVNFDFRERPLSASEMVALMNTVFKKEEEFCRFIHEKIPESFSLGGVKYISNIASVESGDEDVNSIIESVFDKTEWKVEPVSNEKKILDAYHVLIPNNELLSNDESITSESIRKAMKDVKAKQSKMIIYNANEKIPVKTLNYEIDPYHHRVITNLTKPYCVPAVTSRLVNDYLSMTWSFVRGSMNGGYRRDPGEATCLFLELHDTIERIVTSIDQIYKSNGIDDTREHLLKFYESSYELCRLLLKEDVNDRLKVDYEGNWPELKHKIRIINHISTDLFNRYTIDSQHEGAKFAKKAHNDSILLTMILMALSSVLVWSAIVKTGISWYGVRWDTICVLLLAVFLAYHKCYKNESVGVGKNRSVYEMQRIAAS